MRPLELPSADTIKKFARPGAPENTRTAAPVEKNGKPLAAEGAFRSQWTDITPLMAKTWLKNNFRNRPVAEDVVAAYARDMVNGVWQATHQGIAFNDRDELIDGQHRLLAIVKAGKTIRMMVTFGLPAKIAGSEMTVMDCVDRGRTRTVADQLKIQHGLKNGTQIAQLASGIAGLCHERVRRLSVGQTLDIYREFKVPMDFIIANRSKDAGLKSAGVLAAFVFVMRTDEAWEDCRGDIAQMFRALNTGDGLEKFPVVKLLRDFLTGKDSAMLIQSLNRGIAELAVQVLFLETKKEKVATLKYSLDGVNHFRARQPARVAKVAAMFKLPTVEPVAGAKPAAPRTPAQPVATKVQSHICGCGKPATVHSRFGWCCVRCHMIESRQ